MNVPESLSRQSSINLPRIATAADCERFTVKNSICLWGSGGKAQSVEVFCHFKDVLEKHGHNVIFFVKSDGLDLLDKFCNLSEQRNIYICDNPDLLKYCPNIALLIAPENIGERPAGFSGKMCILQHNASVNSMGLSADYTLTSGVPSENFPFERYPNTLKYSRYLTFIPANLKFGMLSCMSKEKYIKGLYIVFYPTAIVVSEEVGIVLNSTLKNQYIQLIEEILVKYPKYKFVLIPYKTDIDSEFYRDIENTFKDNERFIYEVNFNNYHWLAVADICITDASNIVRTFSLSTLRPAIKMKIQTASGQTASGEATFLQTNFGYSTSDVPQTMLAIADALASMPEWEQRLAAQRAQLFPYPETSAEHLARHIPQMLNGEHVAGWTRIDKKNTPSATVADWLRLLKSPIASWLPDYTPAPNLYAYAARELGHNAQVCLAVNRAYIRLWPSHRINAFHFTKMLEASLPACPPRYLRGMLRHIIKKNPAHIAAHTYFSETCTLHYPHDPGLKESLCVIRDALPLQSAALVAMATRLLRLHGLVSSKDLLQHMETSFAGRTQWFDVCYPVYAALLYESTPETLPDFLSAWRSLAHPDPNLLSFVVFTLFSRWPNRLTIPPDFWRYGKFTANVTALFTQEQNRLEAEQILQQLLPRDYPTETAQIYFQLAYIHAARNNLDEAMACIDKAMDVQPNSQGLCHAFSDFMMQQGNVDALERVLRKVLEINPRVSWAYIKMAWLCELCENLDGAILCVRKAIELEPKVARHHAALEKYIKRKVASTKKADI